MGIAMNAKKVMKCMTNQKICDCTICLTCLRMKEITRGELLDCVGGNCKVDMIKAYRQCCSDCNNNKEVIG